MATCCSRSLESCDHAAVIGVRLIELEHRELGVVLRRDAFVPKVAIDFVHAFETADQQALQVELGSDAEIEVEIERVVMCDERARRRAAVERLHHGRFYFEEAARIELPPERLDDLRTRDESLSHLRIRDQVDIALAIARFDIFKAVPLLGQREHDFRKEVEVFDVNGELAGSGAKQIAGDADDVADIKQFVKLVGRFAHRIFFDIDLQLLAVLLQVEKAGFAHAPDGR